MHHQGLMADRGSADRAGRRRGGEAGQDAVAPFNGAGTACAITAALMSLTSLAAAQSAPGTQQSPSLRGADGAVACTAEGGRAFVVERRGERATLQFADSPEVLALKIVPGPRGDELFKTDTDEVVLRVTALGGLTLYLPDAPNGVPAVIEAPSAPIRPPSKPPQGLYVAFQKFSAELARAGAALSIQADAQAEQYSAQAVEAAHIAAAGLKSAERAQVTSLKIEIAPLPSASVEGSALIVRLAPQLGYAGRPSAEAVRQVIAASGKAPNAAPLKSPPEKPAAAKPAP